MSEQTMAWIIMAIVLLAAVHALTLYSLVSIVLTGKRAAFPHREHDSRIVGIGER